MISNASGLPIGVMEASGPRDAVNAGWWIDYQSRGRGFGKEAVALLAHYLKREGYTGVGLIAVIADDKGSETASRRLRAHFIEVMRTMPVSEHL